MRINKLKEGFTPSMELATTNKEAPSKTNIGLILSGAMAEEEIFSDNEKEVMDNLHKNDVIADTKDDKEATGKSRDYDKENPTRIVDNEYTNPEKYSNSAEKKSLGESAKLTLSEGVCVKSKKSLKEDMGASILSDGREILAGAWTTSTRMYVTEHCEVQVGYRKEEGIYKWMNRPWQRFEYEEAFKEAMLKLGFDKDDIDDATSNSYDLQGAVKKFAEIYNDKNPKSVDESIGKDLTKYQMRVDYDLERDGHISDKTLELLRREGLTVVKDRYGYWEVIVKEPIHEDTIKKGNKWTTKGTEGIHGDFRTKRCADAQHRTMFADVYKESKKLTENPIYDLHPNYDSRKSFYSKAKVDEKPDGTQILYSYNTPVCKITPTNDVKLLPRWDESATTLRHVKEFLRQNGFEANSLSQIRNSYQSSDDALTEKKISVVDTPSGYTVRVARNDETGDDIIDIDDKEFIRIQSDALANPRAQQKTYKEILTLLGDVDDAPRKAQAIADWIASYRGNFDVNFETGKMLLKIDNKPYEIDFNDLFEKEYNPVSDDMLKFIDDKIPDYTAKDLNVLVSSRVNTSRRSVKNYLRGKIPDEYVDDFSGPVSFQYWGYLDSRIKDEVKSLAKKLSDISKDGSKNYYKKATKMSDVKPEKFGWDSETNPNSLMPVVVDRLFNVTVVPQNITYGIESESTKTVDGTPYYDSERMVDFYPGKELGTFIGVAGNPKSENKEEDKEFSLAKKIADKLDLMYEVIPDRRWGHEFTDIFMIDFNGDEDTPIEEYAEDHGIRADDKTATTGIDASNLRPKATRSK